MKIKKLLALALSALMLTGCGLRANGWFEQELHAKIVERGEEEKELYYEVSLDPKNDQRGIIDITKNALEVKATTCELVMLDYYSEDMTKDKVYLRESEKESNTFAEGVLEIVPNKSYSEEELYPLEYYSDSLAAAFNINIEKYFDSKIRTVEESEETELFFKGSKVMLIATTLGKFNGGFIKSRSDVSSFGIDSEGHFTKTRTVKFGHYEYECVVGEKFGYIWDQLITDKDIAGYTKVESGLYFGDMPFNAETVIEDGEGDIVLTAEPVVPAEE